MEQYDVIVIGSGIGGLICANILAVEGHSVCVLEKNRQLGGALQTFSRNKVLFDSGVHYIGGLAKGQNLFQIFSYLQIMDKLKLERMDESGFDRILISDDEKEYRLGQGYENFIAGLTSEFPDEGNGIRKYCDTIKNICSKFPLYNLRAGGSYSEKSAVLEEGAFGFINSVTTNKKLRAVLAGNNILYAGDSEHTPLYVHALIVNSYIESAWKCIDGGSQIAKLLSANIRSRKGEICNKAEVVRIVEEKGRVAFVELADGQRLAAASYISNVHPAQTLEMLASNTVRGAYRRRIKSLANSISCICVNVILKEDSFPYFSHNYYWHKEDEIWNQAAYNEANWPLGYALFISPSRKPRKYAEALTILAYMRYDEVDAWKNTFNTEEIQNDRGETYQAFKDRKAGVLFDAVEKKFPDFKNKIKSFYVATPLSYRDYIGTSDGSMYGISKDYRDPIKTLIAPGTKLPNLYLTGQNLNLHGILGAAITALSTCTAILGNEMIIEKIKNA